MRQRWCCNHSSTPGTSSPRGPLTTGLRLRRARARTGAPCRDARLRDGRAGLCRVGGLPGWVLRGGSACGPPPRHRRAQRAGRGRPVRAGVERGVPSCAAHPVLAACARGRRLAGSRRASERARGRPVHRRSPFAVAAGRRSGPQDRRRRGPRAHRGGTGRPPVRRDDGCRCAIAGGLLRAHREAAAHLLGGGVSVLARTGRAGGHRSRHRALRAPPPLLPARPRLGAVALRVSHRRQHDGGACALLRAGQGGAPAPGGRGLLLLGNSNEQAASAQCVSRTAPAGSQPPAGARCVSVTRPDEREAGSRAELLAVPTPLLRAVGR